MSACIPDSLPAVPPAQAQFPASPAGPVPAGTEFRVLGPVEARRAGQRVPVTGARQLSVLAALVLGAGRAVTTGRLARAVWDDMPPPTARTQIQGSVARLRRALPGLIRTVGDGYLLTAASGQVDAAVFRSLVLQALAAGRPAEAAGLFRSALRLWRGAALDGATGLGPEAADLEQQRVGAVQGWFAAELAAGRHAEVIPDLYGNVLTLPWHEPLRGLLMIALYRCGREADALAAYRDARRVLAEHLGTEPGPGLRRIEQAIRVRDPGLAASPATRLLYR